MSQPKVGKSRKSTDPGFAPRDFTDDRARYDWASKWGPGAWWRMTAEACWLMLLVSLAVCSVFRESRLLQTAFTVERQLWTAGAAGMLGGTVFGMKWLYHSAAKGLWHSDRRWWRIFTPMLSAVVGVVVSLITLHGDITKAAAAHDIAGRCDLFVNTLIHAFLGGYFSDNAIAKLQEMATRMLGPTTSVASRNSEQADHVEKPPQLESAGKDRSVLPADEGDRDDEPAARNPSSGTS